MVGLVSQLGSLSWVHQLLSCISSFPCPEPLQGTLCSARVLRIYPVLCSNGLHPSSSLCQAFSDSWFKASEMLTGNAGQRDGLGWTCCTWCWWNGWMTIVGAHRVSDLSLSPDLKCKSLSPLPIITFYLILLASVRICRRTFQGRLLSKSACIIFCIFVRLIYAYAI